MSKNRDFQSRVQRSVIKTLANNIEPMTIDQLVCEVRWATPEEVRLAVLKLNRRQRVKANIETIEVLHNGKTVHSFDIKKVTWEINGPLDKLGAL